MILYANGCSHTAAAEAVHSAAFAEDDEFHRDLGRRPHPDNLAVSWCSHLATHLQADLECDAESASSNDRIIRTTRAWIHSNQHRLNQVLMVLQWSTWERQEWWYQDQWYQVNASGQDQVPPELQDRYQRYIADVDWNQCTQQAHERIWQLHRDLTDQGIAHVFFNGNCAFDQVLPTRCWQKHYLAPYDPGHTFDAVLRTQGFSGVNSNSYHFGAQAHCFWAKYLLQYINDHNLAGITCDIS